VDPGAPTEAGGEPEKERAVSKRHGFGPVLTEAKVPGDFPIGSSVGVYFNGHWYAGRTISHGKRTVVRVAFTTGGTRARETDVSVARLDQVLDHGAVVQAALRIRYLDDGVVAPPQAAPRVRILGLDDKPALARGLAEQITRRTGAPVAVGPEADEGEDQDEDEVEAADGEWEPTVEAPTAEQVVAERAVEREAGVAVRQASAAVAGAERSTPRDAPESSATWYLKLTLDAPIDRAHAEALLAGLGAALKRLGRKVEAGEAYPDLTGDEDEEVA
jgi:hypothetical protein